LIAKRVLVQKDVVNGEISHANEQDSFRPEEIGRKSRREIQNWLAAEILETRAREECRSGWQRLADRTGPGTCSG